MLQSLSRTRLVSFVEVVQAGHSVDAKVAEIVAQLAPPTQRSGLPPEEQTQRPDATQAGLPAFVAVTQEFSPLADRLA